MFVGNVLNSSLFTAAMQPLTPPPPPLLVLRLAFQLKAFYGKATDLRIFVFVHIVKILCFTLVTHRERFCAACRESH